MKVLSPQTLYNVRVFRLIYQMKWCHWAIKLIDSEGNYVCSQFVHELAYIKIYFYRKNFGVQIRCMFILKTYKYIQRGEETVESKVLTTQLEYIK